MPSTVKVRVKGARNLPPMDSRRPNLNPTSGSSPVSGLFHPTGVGAFSGPPSIDAYVIVSLGGHSSNLIASEEDELTNRTGGGGGGGSNTTSSNVFTTTTTTGGGGGGGSSSASSALKQKGYTAKTKVCRRNLNPVWDEEFRFDVSSDTMLQDEPLIFRVCDWDAIAADESIGLVYIDLNPLLSNQATRADEADPHHDVSLRLDAWKGGISTGVIDGWFPLYDTLGGVRGELGLSVKLNFIGGEYYFCTLIVAD